MAGKKPNVLIVDDEKVICDLLNDELTERDYKCATAMSGDEALTKMKQDKFDVILLDIRLPGMSGMEVLREVWLNHADTAAIMLTAVNDVTTAVEAMKLGASDYLIKPFNLDKVDASIRHAIESKQPPGKSVNEMDAIASGVATSLDPFSAFSKAITQRTADIARNLGIDEKEIQRWATAKNPKLIVK